jgi:3D (Asp-Asp-Asp) domain-containing protein
LRRRRLRLAKAAASALLVIAVAAVSAGASFQADVAQKQELANLYVRIVCDGTERQVRTAQTTVGATLAMAGVRLAPADYVIPHAGTRITPGTVIQVVRVEGKTIETRQQVGFRTIRKATPSLRPGLTQVKSEGRTGEKIVTYRVRYENGKEVSRKVVGSRIVTKPQDRVILVGQRGFMTSRGFFSSRRVLRMFATGYDPGPRSCGRYASGYTSCGYRAGYGVVAVDPRTIALRSRLYIEGYGFAIAGDTGSAIRGDRIDLGFDSYREAKRFGMKHVTVHVLE